MRTWLENWLSKRARSTKVRSLEKTVRERDAEIERLANRIHMERDELLDGFDEEREGLNREITGLRESLESEQVRNRIKDMEIEELAAVVVRNRNRVRAENDVTEPKHQRSGAANLTDRISG